MIQIDFEASDLQGVLRDLRTLANTLATVRETNVTGMTLFYQGHEYKEKRLTPKSLIMMGRQLANIESLSAEVRLSVWTNRKSKAAAFTGTQSEVTASVADLVTMLIVVDRMRARLKK